MSVRAINQFSLFKLFAQWGVVLQGIAKFSDERDHSIAVGALSLGIQANKVCVFYQHKCIALDLNPSLAAATAA